MKTRSIKCNFKNSRNFMLDARLDLPLDSTHEMPATYVIFCHCFTCSKETITTYRLSRLLAERGYGVLRFDFTGLGNSEGEFSASTFSTTQDDLRCAIAFLENTYKAPSFLMGHSLGGTSALSIAEDFDSIKGVVTVASPSRPDHVLHHFGHALTLLEQNIAASFDVAGTRFDIDPAFVEDVRRFDMQKNLTTLLKPLLVFNVEGDALVSERDAQEITNWSAGMSSRIDLAGTDHLLSDRPTTIDVADKIVEWMQRIES